MEQQIEVAKVKEEYCPEDETCSTINQLQEYGPVALKQEELNIKSELVDEKPFICVDCPSSSTISIKQLHEYDSFALKHEELAELDVKSEIITMEQQTKLTKVKEEYCPEDQTSSNITHLQEPDSFSLKHEELDIKSEIIDANEKSFTCAECPESFAYGVLLDIHKTIHRAHWAPIKQEKKCPCCNRTYLSVLRYKLHIQNHLTSYRQCTFCPKIFFHGNLFHRHIADHKWILKLQMQSEHCIAK